MANSLWPHGLQPARLPCPSLSPRVGSNLCPSSQWYYMTISSSAAPFSFCLQSFSASGCFPVSSLKYQSFSFSISPSNEYSGLISFRIDWLISLQSKGFSRVFFGTTVQRHQLFRAQPSLWSNLHINTWLLEKSCILLINDDNLNKWLTHSVPPFAHLLDAPTS